MFLTIRTCFNVEFGSKDYQCPIFLGKQLMFLTLRTCFNVKFSLERHYRMVGVGLGNEKQTVYTIICP